MCIAAQEISKDFWKLILLPALESWKNFCVLNSFVIFGDVSIIQQFAFLIFQSLCIVQIMRQNA